MFRKLILILLFIMISTKVYAGTYWVHPVDNTAIWGDCLSGADPGAGNYCSMATAISNAVAGDIVMFKAGTYDDQSLIPVNAGSSGNPITWQSEVQHGAVLTDTGETPGGGADQGVQLNNDYHVIDGFEIHSQDRTIWLENASYNEIKNNKLHDGLYVENGSFQSHLIALRGTTGSKHNWIHDNEAYDNGHFSGAGCDDFAGIIQLGDLDEGYQDNNTIEDNHLYHGAHGVINMFGANNVIRNNVLHGEGWKAPDSECLDTHPEYRPPWDSPGSGLYGSPLIEMHHSNANPTRNEAYNLFENNRLGWGVNPPTDDGCDGFTFSASRNIFRYNRVFAIGADSVEAKGLVGGSHTWTRIYNNTLFHGGYGDGVVQYETCTRAGAQIAISNDAGNNHYINNIIYDTHPNAKEHDTFAGGDVDRGNWFESISGDPELDGVDLSDKTSTTKPELNLQDTSGAIDNGSYLTQANGSGSSSTTLVVDDALFFQYGERGSSLSNIQADYIAIGTIGNTVQISSINYSTNTITLSSSITWNDNADIWLYKDSDGTVILSGLAPDQGAYEFGGITSPPEDATTEWANHGGYEWADDYNEWVPVGGSVSQTIPAISTDQGSIDELGW